MRPVLLAVLLAVLLVGCYGSHGAGSPSPASMGPIADAGPDAAVVPPAPTGDPVSCGPNMCLAGEICCDPVCGACTLAEACVDYECGTGP